MEWNFDEELDSPLYPRLPILVVVTERGIEVYGSKEFVDLRIVHQPAICWKVSPGMVRQLEIEGEKFVMGSVGREHKGIFTPSCLLGVAPSQPMTWEQIAKAQQQLRALSAMGKIENEPTTRKAPGGNQ